MNPGPASTTSDLVTTSTAVSGAARLHVFATAPVAGRTPILFLHADVCDSRMWGREMVTLAAARRCAAFDRRGFGGTAAAHERYDNVDDTIAVLDALGIERALLVGCSHGGRVAVDTALAHPPRVAGLALVCAGIGGAPQSGAWVDDPRLAAIYAQWLDAEKRGDRPTLVRLAARVWLDGPLESDGRVGGAVRNLFVDMMSTSLVAPEADDLRILGDTAYARLSSIAVPTLVAWGPLDEPDTVATMRQAAATIPRAQSFEIPGTAHLPNLERPDLFVPRLARFAGSLD